MAKRNENEKGSGKEKDKSLFHEDLEGFEISVNAFGELQSSFDVDKINAFLNRKVDDKKLKGRDDLPGSREEE